MALYKTPFNKDPIAIQYYQEAKNQPNLEAPSRNYWAYQLQIHDYPENCFWLTSEHATAGKSGHVTQLRRKIDQIMNYAASDGKGGISRRQVLIVIQAKRPNATTEEIDYCEEQTFDAARAATEAGIPFVYALTTIGVTYIFRLFQAHGDRFFPIFPEDESASINPGRKELYSDPFENPLKWLKYVQATRNMPPSEIYGLGGKQAGIYFQTDYSLPSTYQQQSSAYPQQSSAYSQQSSAYSQQSSAYPQQPRAAAPQAPSSVLQVLGKSETGVKLKYQERSVRTTYDYIYIAGLGCYHVDQKTAMVEPREALPTDKPIHFCFEPGWPVKQLNGNKWYTLDNMTNTFHAA